MANPNDVLGNLGGIITNNPALALSGLGLGAAALMGDQPPLGQQQIQQQANQLQQQGGQMLAQGIGGGLPAGAQAAVNLAEKGGEAQVRSRYSNMGLSGSTMEAVDLGAIQQQAGMMAFKMSTQMIQEGVKMLGMSGEEFDVIAKANLQKDDALLKALGSFAGAMAGAH